MYSAIVCECMCCTYIKDLFIISYLRTYLPMYMHLQVIKNTLSPFWPPFELKANLFGNENKRIRVSCYDWDADGGHDLIGVFHTSLSELQSGKKLHWDLINEKKTKKKSYKNSGVIECSVEVCSCMLVHCKMCLCMCDYSPIILTNVHVRYM